METYSINPILRTDYPDPDVIRVQDTYYMVSTTMHFSPGGVILQSYDLKNWEIAGYIFDTLESSPEERLEGEQSNYGCGMWAACLRYHQGRFYASFVAHGTGKTYLFTAEDVRGRWEKHYIEGDYHDNSLLFDDDGRVYIVYGQKQIWATELRQDLSGPKEGGLHRMLVEDTGDVYLGYEGSHIYKIRDRYYLFLIHWPKGGTGRRTQACFAADSMEGGFVGGDVLDDDRHYHNQGVAQGGLVDTPNGKWYAVLFQDSGAVGRIPVLVPVRWEKGFPVFGVRGRVPGNMEIVSSRPYYRYEPLYTSDEFVCRPEDEGGQRLKLQWQWNHEPDGNLWRIRPEGGIAITTGKVCVNVTQAVNTLTQRMMWPKCAAEITVDASGLKEGDVAGLCALQGCYGLLGIQRDLGGYYLVVIERRLEDAPVKGRALDYMPGTVVERTKLAESRVRLRLNANFEDMQDYVEYFYQKQNRWTRIGDRHRLYFRLDHFVGCRFGLFVYSTKKSGGEAVFTDFRYLYD